VLDCQPGELLEFRRGDPADDAVVADVSPIEE
jgi:hypothetical protein